MAVSIGDDDLIDLPGRHITKRDRHGRTVTLHADYFGPAVGYQPFNERARCEVGDRQWTVSLRRAAGGPQTYPPLEHRNHVPYGGVVTTMATVLLARADR